MCHPCSGLSTKPVFAFLFISFLQSLPDPNYLHTQLLSTLQQMPAVLERTAKCHAHVIVRV